MGKVYNLLNSPKNQSASLNDVHELSRNTTADYYFTKPIAKDAIHVPPNAHRPHDIQQITSNKSYCEMKLEKPVFSDGHTSVISKLRKNTWINFFFRELILF